VIDTITASAPIIAFALAHQAEQGAVTFLFGSLSVYVEQVRLPSGEALDPMGAVAALTRLNKAFTAAGWGSSLNLGAEGDITSATFAPPRYKETS
jgi:hypothetical protein